MPVTTCGARVSTNSRSKRTTEPSVEAIAIAERPTMEASQGTITPYAGV